MRLALIGHAGLRARDAERRLGEVTIFVGPNGAGKTAEIDAIHLLVHGRGSDPALPKTSAGIERLARGDRLEVWADVMLDDSTETRVTRSWSRDARG